MVIDKVPKKNRRNLFVSDQEVQILWKFSKKFSKKYQILLSFAVFRGLRIGEIVAINILDFKNDFSILRVITEKTHIEMEIPIIFEHKMMIKEYVLMNKHTFKDGYLFPFYTSRKNAPHLTAITAEAMFCKLRKQIGKEHPEFLDHHVFPNGQIRYRISLHSLRRWFETRIYANLKDRKALADIMRYVKTSTVDTYINPYETWAGERDILENTFNSSFVLFQQVSKDQKRITEFLK